MLQEAAKLFPKVAVPIYLLTFSVWEDQFLHILVNTFYFVFAWIILYCQSVHSIFLILIF